MSRVTLVGHEHRLHKGLGLREVEQLPAVGVAAHFQDPLRLVVADVGERACGHVDGRVPPALGGGDHVVGQFVEPFEGAGIAKVEFGFGFSHSFKMSIVGLD